MSHCPFHLSFHHSRCDTASLFASKWLDGLRHVISGILAGEIPGFRMVLLLLRSPSGMALWFCCSSLLFLLPCHVKMTMLSLLHQLAHKLAPVTPLFGCFVLGCCVLLCFCGFVFGVSFCFWLVMTSWRTGLCAAPLQSYFATCNWTCWTTWRKPWRLDGKNPETEEAVHLSRYPSLSSAWINVWSRLRRAPRQSAPVPSRKYVITEKSLSAVSQNKWIGAFFFRPAPAWLPPGRSTRSIACFKLGCKGYGRPLIERPKVNCSRPECRDEVTTKQHKNQTPTKTNPPKQKKQNPTQTKTAKTRCDRCQFMC